jgi:hypothetical protein
MKREALCLGGPLDGKVKPIQGRFLRVPMRVPMRRLATFDEWPRSWTYNSYCIYHIAIKSYADGQREFFWIADES